MNASMRSEPQDQANAVVDRSDEIQGQSPRRLDQPFSFDQLQPEGYSDRIPLESRRRGGEQDVAGKTGPINVRGDRHDMGLPHVDSENIARGHDDARSALVEIDPMDVATRYHGADFAIRSPIARAPRRAPGSDLVSAASARSCSDNGMAVWAACRRSCSVTQRENGMSSLSMIGTTSSGTLIVLLGMYVSYIRSD